jgi:hypothetical protein
LHIRCCGNLFTELLRSNFRLLGLHYSGLLASCYIIIKWPQKGIRRWRIDQIFFHLTAWITVIEFKFRSAKYQTKPCPFLRIRKSQVQVPAQKWSKLTEVLRDFSPSLQANEASTITSHNIRLFKNIDITPNFNPYGRCGE